MPGNLPDIVGRLRAMLPKRWFADETPNLDAVLASLATPAAWLFDALSYLTTQCHLSTSTDIWLDLAALDYFGSWLIRRQDEADNAFRARIQRSLLQPAATRGAITSVLSALTGSTPEIFEPAKCLDTGGYATSAGAMPPFAYGMAGGWGSLMMPFQFFVPASRPPTPGLANLGGWGSSVIGYGGGNTSFINLEALPGEVSDDELRQLLCRLLPINTTAWLRII